MNRNPMELLQLKERFDTFRTEHPKFLAFLGALKNHAVAEGSVMEIKVTTPAGDEYVSNIRMTQNDVEALRLLMGEEDV